MNLDLAMTAWGWALLNFVWQGAVVGAAAVLLLALLRGASARWRYAVCAVGLRLLAELPGPITLGALKPFVLLPAALLGRLPVDLLEALLAHELAHVRRWDYFANLLQSAVEALLFFHPVVWWLSARMRAERELVADEISAEVLGDSRRLAVALHMLAELDAGSSTPR